MSQAPWVQSNLLSGLMMQKRHGWQQLHVDFASTGLPGAQAQLWWAPSAVQPHSRRWGERGGPGRTLAPWTAVDFTSENRDFLREPDRSSPEALSSGGHTKKAVLLLKEGENSPSPRSLPGTRTGGIAPPRAAMATLPPAEAGTRAHPGGCGRRALPPPSLPVGAISASGAADSRDGAGSVARVRGPHRAAEGRGGGWRRIGGGTAPRWAAGEGRRAPPHPDRRGSPVGLGPSPSVCGGGRALPGRGEAGPAAGRGPRAGGCLGRVGGPVTSAGRERLPGRRGGSSVWARPVWLLGQPRRERRGGERTSACVRAAAVQRRVGGGGWHRAASDLKPRSSTCCGVVESVAAPPAQYCTWCVWGLLCLAFTLLSET